MTRHALRGCALALALTLSTGGAVALGDEPAPTVVSGAMTPRPATSAEAAGYAQREKKASPELARFEGGDVVVITTTTLLTVLLVVLIVAVVL